MNASVLNVVVTNAIFCTSTEGEGGEETEASIGARKCSLHGTCPYRREYAVL